MRVCCGALFNDRLDTRALLASRGEDACAWAMTLMLEARSAPRMVSGSGLDSVPETTMARLALVDASRVDLFADRDARLLAAFERAIEGLRLLLVAAYTARERWQDGIRDALTELLGAFDREPALASLCLVDALNGGAPMLHRRAELVAELAAVIDRGRRDGDEALSALTAEGVVGAVLTVLHARTLETPRQPLLPLRGGLMSIVVLPYLGARAARRELIRPVRPARAFAKPRALRAQHPALPAKMRITYRTLRVLEAIAHEPGASNREVADAAGVADEGQISRLLCRLSGLELVVNSGGSPTRRGVNSWLLTAAGQDLLLGCYHRVAARQRSSAVEPG